MAQRGTSTSREALKSMIEDSQVGRHGWQDVASGGYPRGWAFPTVGSKEQLMLLGDRPQQGPLLQETPDQLCLNFSKLRIFLAGPRDLICLLALSSPHLYVSRQAAHNTQLWAPRGNFPQQTSYLRLGHTVKGFCPGRGTLQMSSAYIS